VVACSLVGSEDIEPKLLIKKIKQYIINKLFIEQK
jgi:hypothetical protein